MKFRVSHVPLRLATGAFILNSGINHLKLEKEQADRLHGMAKGAYPALERLEPQPFGQVLAIGEVALGGALLLPFVPASLAGLGLAVFSGSLLGMYARTPGVHEEGSLRPTEQGTVLAKDTWMAGIAAALLIDVVSESWTDRVQRRLKTKVAKAEERVELERQGRDRALAARREEERARDRRAKDKDKASLVKAAGKKAAKMAAKKAAKATVAGELLKHAPGIRSAS